MHPDDAGSWIDPRHLFHQALASSGSVAGCLRPTQSAADAQHQRAPRAAEQPPLLASLSRCLASLKAVSGRAVTADGQEVLHALR